MTRRELILYAVPDGELGDQCRRFFETVRDSGRSTTAQAYPPHVTLTGFFHRDENALNRVVGDVLAALETTAQGPVRVEEMREVNDWLGLDIASDWLSDLAAAFASAHQLEHDDDPVRVKTWLHLSLAYGDLPPNTTLAEYATLARSTITAAAPAVWNVGLWERRRLQWERHG